MDTLNFSETVMPKSFRNAVISHDSESVEIRSSVKSLSDIKIWVEEFSENTKTRWIVRKTRPRESSNLQR